VRALKCGVPLQKPLPNWTARLVMFVAWCITGVAPFALAWALGKYHGPLWHIYVFFPPLILLWFWVTALFIGTWSEKWGERIARCLSRIPPGKG
jgi:hypothetical protein